MTLYTINGIIIIGTIITADIVFIAMYTVDVQIIESATPQVGVSDYFLTCVVSGANSHNLSGRIAYQWFDSTQTRIGNSSVLSLSPLTLSRAGRYFCEVTLLEHPNNVNNTSVRTSKDVIIPSEYYCGLLLS